MTHHRPNRQWRIAGISIVTAMLSTTIAAKSQTDIQDLSNLSLEDLMHVHVEQVFGASKRLQPATEAPSSVSIITAGDIERFGYRSLADILRGVRGMYVTYDRNYSYVGARGFGLPGDYNTRVLLVVDGHRMNDDVYDQAAIGPELDLDPATFQRVEIIRGPSSALYGTSAFFAVVNITTKRGADINGVAVGADVGSFDIRRGYGSVGRAFANGVDVAISGNTEITDGARDLYDSVYDAPDTNNGHAIGLDGQRARGFAGRLQAKDFTFTGAYGWRRKTVPTGAFDTLFNDPRFDTVDERSFVDAAYDHTAHATRYNVRVYADQYNYDATYPYAPLVAGDPTVMSTDYGHGAWWGAEGRVTRALPGSQTLTGGTEYRDYVRQDQGEQYDDLRSPTFTTSVSTHVFAGYIQDEVRIRTRWLVNAGSRYDAYSGFGQFSPRASVVFMATPQRSFKYLFGTAFRAPNAYEFDYLSGGMRNTSLRAEMLRTNELAWEEYKGDWLRTSVSAYRNAADRLITLRGEDYTALSYANLGRVRARGLEFEAEMKSQKGFDALASYAWQHAEDRDTGDPLVNSPHHLGKIRFSAPGPVTHSTLSCEVLAMSSRRLLAGGVTGGYAVVNVNYLQPLGSRLKLTVSARNLFDADYSDPASEEHLEAVIPQDGISVRVGVQFTWKR